MLFSAQEYRPKGYSGLLLRVGSGMKSVVERILWVPGVMVALPVEGHGRRVGGLVAPLAIIGRSDGRFDRWLLPIDIGIALVIDYWDCA
jgi:hypothetical protein